MKNFCTLSDSSFLPYGLALHKSIEKNISEEFKLYYLCTDEEAYTELVNLNIKTIVPLSLRAIEESDGLLKNAKNNRPSFEALNVGKRINKSPKEVQYFWCLSPYLCWYMLENYDLEDILYVDSDIFFFNDLKTIYDEVGDKSVGIVRHRIPYNSMVGEFNVGVVYFRKNLIGYQCAEFWKNCLFNINNPHYQTHGMCGDQKYLELFSPMFGKQNIRIIDEKVGHLAPWNFLYHGYKDGKILWQSAEQDLTYCHFSNFKPDFVNDSYEMAPRHDLIPEIKSNEFIKSIYQKYFNVVKLSREALQ